MKSPDQKTLLRTAMLVLLAGLPVACTETALNGADGGGTGDFASIYQTSTFQMCKECHAPDAPGKTAGTETTQNWSSSDTAFASLKGKAAGLVGNFAGCNGVPLVGSTSSASLVVAVLDADVRAGFSVSAYPSCKAAAIPDETLMGRVGSVPSAVLQDLRDFIDGGGFR
jgi:hypothetical protein